MSSFWANQEKITAFFSLLNQNIVASGDTVEQAIAKLQAQNLGYGIGTYLGNFNAETHTPNLLDSTVDPVGSWYHVTVGGTVNFGTVGVPHEITLEANDVLYSNGTVYAQGVQLVTSVPMADGTILIGGVDGLGHAQTMTGDQTITNAGVISNAYAARTTAGTFDGTIRGDQYINADISMPIASMVIGREYPIYNSDLTNIRFVTPTGTGIAITNGDGLFDGTKQGINPLSSLVFKRINATTVTIVC